MVKLNFNLPFVALASVAATQSGLGLDNSALCISGCCGLELNFPSATLSSISAGIQLPVAGVGIPCCACDSVPIDPASGGAVVDEDPTDDTEPVPEEPSARRAPPSYQQPLKAKAPEQHNITIGFRNARACIEGCCFKHIPPVEIALRKIIRSSSADIGLPCCDNCITVSPKPGDCDAKAKKPRHPPPHYGQSEL